MSRIIYEPEGEHELKALLEGYLFAIGETCHRLFGPEGELAMYRAFGSYLVPFLRDKLGAKIDADDPWDRYCAVIELYTRYGFYSHVELEQRGDNSYWMIEHGQYAGHLWEEMRAWERGTAPCPLWASLLQVLSEIGVTIELDEVQFDEDTSGFESTFHFTKYEAPEADAVDAARHTLQEALVPICAHCKAVRKADDKWVRIETYLSQRTRRRLTHTVCPTCLATHYPDLDEDTP